MPFWDSDNKRPVMWTWLPFTTSYILNRFSSIFCCSHLPLLSGEMALSNGHQKEMFQEIKNDERKCLPSEHWQLRSSITASKAFYFLCSGSNPDCARSARLVLIRWYYSWASVSFPSCSSLATKNQKSCLKDIRLAIGAYIFEVHFGQAVDNNY